MMINLHNLKNVCLATVGIVTAGMFDPAWGIEITFQDTLGNLIGTSHTVGNFTFSEFTAGVTDPDGLGEADWLASNVILSDGSDGNGLTPSLSLSSNNLIPGGYTLTYLLTASVASGLFFESADQNVPCVEAGTPCLGNPDNGVTTDTIFRRTSSVGTGIGSVADTQVYTFDKDPSPSIVNNPVSVDTFIEYNGGGAYTGFSQTNATAVPWETDVLPLVGATILFGGGMWWKRRRGASQIDMTPQGQEPGQE